MSEKREIEIGCFTWGVLAVMALALMSIADSMGRIADKFAPETKEQTDGR